MSRRVLNIFAFYWCLNLKNLWIQKVKHHNFILLPENKDSVCLLARVTPTKQYLFTNLSASNSVLSLSVCDFFLSPGGEFKKLTATSSQFSKHRRCDGDHGGGRWTGVCQEDHSWQSAAQETPAVRNRAWLGPEILDKLYFLANWRGARFLIN